MSWNSQRRLFKAAFLLSLSLPWLGACVDNSSPLAPKIGGRTPGTRTATRTATPLVSPTPSFTAGPTLTFTPIPTNTLVPTASTVPTASPTATATPVVINVGAGPSFSPNAITIPSGATVSFNLTNIHTVHIDDGTGTGTCGPVDYTGPTWPYLYNNFVGLPGTVFRVHCDVHATCIGGAASSCSGCANMVMSVT
ncbi:MAG TPA: hypothetical protein VNZ67_14015, partial [bacterium]|nr:hypothetical protein [bacterium]